MFQISHFIKIFQIHSKVTESFDTILKVVRNVGTFLIKSSRFNHFGSSTLKLVHENKPEKC